MSSPDQPVREFDNTPDFFRFILKTNSQAFDPITLTSTNGSDERIEVREANALTESERNQVRDAFLAKNTDLLNEKLPGQNIDVSVSENGTVTVRYPDGTSDTIAANEAIKSEPLDAYKAKAKTTLQEKANEKITAINGDARLTNEEKASAVRAVNDQLTTANNAITQAQTKDNVDTEKTSGTGNITGVSATPVVKPAATQSIVDAAMEANRIIDQDGSLTQEEKVKAKQAVNTAKEAAKRAVNDAQTNDDVDAAARGFAPAKPVGSKKPEAKSAIQSKADTAKREVDGNAELTEEEKATAKSAIQSKADEAKGKVDAATTDAAVAKLASDFTAPAAPAASSKPTAKSAIQSKADTAKREVDGNAELMEEEKATASNLPKTNDAGSVAASTLGIVTFLTSLGLIVPRRKKD